MARQKGREDSEYSGSNSNSGIKKVPQSDYDSSEQEYTSPVKKKVKRGEEILGSLDKTAGVASQPRRQL